MEKSALVRLIRSFSPVELRDVRKFLNSPFFNQREDLTRLFEWIVATHDLEKEKAWKHLFGATSIDNPKMRLLMSYLHQLMEQYIAVKELTSDNQRVQLNAAVGYRKRGLSDAFERTRKALEKNLDLQASRNAQYHEMQYRLNWEAHQLAYAQNPTDLSRLQDLSETTDVIFLAQKLQLICLLSAHQSVYRADRHAGWDEYLVGRAEQPQFAQLPAIAVYLHCYRMLQYPEEELHFQEFKTILLNQSDCFSPEEMHGLYILAINYCVRQLNAGARRFSNEALDLYKKGLAKGYLFENGMLTRFTYYNIVAAGLQTGELDWVRFFINEYKNRLEKRYRESSFSFNLARLEYANQNYGFVLELLQKANYRDPLLNLSAKTLLLKTYYDLGEHDLLQSHLDAMRNYIHRKRVIGYHRTNYLNIIRYMEKVIRLNQWDKAALDALQTALAKEEVLSEKAYFQKILHVS